MKKKLLIQCSILALLTSIAFAADLPSHKGPLEGRHSNTSSNGSQPANLLRDNPISNFFNNLISPNNKPAEALGHNKNRRNFVQPSIKTHFPKNSSHKIDSSSSPLSNDATSSGFDAPSSSGGRNSSSGASSSGFDSPSSSGGKSSSGADKERGGDKPGADKERGGDKSGADKERSGDKSGADKERGGDKSGADKERGGDKSGADKERGGDKSGADKERSGDKSAVDLSLIHISEPTRPY